MGGQKKTVWGGVPVRKVAEFHEFLSTESGRITYFARLSCGHLVQKSPSNLQTGVKRGVKRHGFACDVCGYYLKKAEKAEKKVEAAIVPATPTTAPAPAVEQMSEMMKLMQQMASSMQKLDARMTDIEEMKTQPEEDEADE